jgi:hypothetical protein
VQGSGFKADMAGVPGQGLGMPLFHSWVIGVKLLRQQSVHKNKVEQNDKPLD